MATEQPFSQHLIREHTGRFERIEQENRTLRDQVRELKEQMDQYSPLIERMDADLYNHGKEGLKTKFDKFTAIQDDRHKQNSTKINLVIALLSLLCAILMVIIAFKGLTKTSQIITDPLHSKIPIVAMMR